MDVQSEISGNASGFESNEAQNANSNTLSVYVYYTRFLLIPVVLINGQLPCMNIRFIGQPGQPAVFIKFVSQPKVH